MPKIAAVTICSHGYLSKALVLAESYLEHHPADVFHIVLVDRRSAPPPVDRPDIRLMWAEDLGIANFLSHAFAFDVIELSTNIKPTVLQRLLVDYEAVIYLDPDIEVFAPLTPVRSALENDAIVVTPHYGTPIEDGHKPDDVDLLRFGPFNLGFLAVPRSAEARSFLDWWSARCLRFGYYEPQLGLAVDQGWISLAPCFFPSLFVLRDPGCNVAFWNLHERSISKRGEQWFINDVAPLRFMHFSSFDSARPEVVAHKQSRFAPGSRPDFEAVAQPYAERLRRAGEAQLAGTPYSFERFSDGSLITPALRRFYAGMRDSTFKNVADPFSATGPVRAFANRNGLLGSAGTPAARQTFRDSPAYRRESALLLRGFRTALRVLGPQRYFNLMRFLAHMSSLRNQVAMFGKRG